MAHDRGLEGPADSQSVDVPDGVTPEQVRAGEAARRVMMEHLGRRRVLNMDELATLKDQRPRLEKEMRLPGDKRGSKNRIYFFSIDGVIDGAGVSGCLFAGECIMVQSERGFEHALKLAKDGLAETIELAYTYWKESQGALLKPMDPLVVEVGGGRAGRIQSSPTSRPIRS
jgi:hypothetical protein